MNPAIIVMCKAPTAGTVKTRLAPFLSAEQSADLAGCFAIDAVKKARNICENTIVAFAGEKEILETILPRNLIWVRQTGADLGERMHNALRFAFERNFSPLVVIGTDSPTLPPEYIKAAIKILQEKLTDAVIGETEDGGFYLLGLNQPNQQIFQNVRWSSPETFLQTVRNIRQLNLHLTTLPLWYDVDTPKDLRRLKTEIENNARAGEIAPETAPWLERHNQIF
ncbi:MAG TPA: TIGR04282 family arsenosugar biosynthesis glycosyltransferase [Pyrinomonadaceae bacterium]|jgi:hypothetical protein